MENKDKKPKKTSKLQILEERHKQVCVQKKSMEAFIQHVLQNSDLAINYESEALIQQYSIITEKENERRNRNIKGLNDRIEGLEHLMEIKEGTIQDYKKQEELKIMNNAENLLGQLKRSFTISSQISNPKSDSPENNKKNTSNKRVNELELKIKEQIEIIKNLQSKLNFSDNSPKQHNMSEIEIQTEEDKETENKIKKLENEFEIAIDDKVQAQQNYEKLRNDFQVFFE